MVVSIHKLENYSYGLSCDISERGVYTGTGKPISEEEVKDIDSMIEQQRLSFEKQLGELVKVIIEEDVRTIQQTLI